jgi:hypothetical protein
MTKMTLIPMIKIPIPRSDDDSSLVVGNGTHCDGQY